MKNFDNLEGDIRTAQLAGGMDVKLPSNIEVNIQASGIVAPISGTS
jgi:hypothetical protein